MHFERFAQGPILLHCYIRYQLFRENELTPRAFPFCLSFCALSTPEVAGSGIAEDFVAPGRY
jgi:hypothetical protein